MFEFQVNKDWKNLSSNNNNKKMCPQGKISSTDNLDRRRIWSLSRILQTVQQIWPLLGPHLLTSAMLRCCTIQNAFGKPREFLSGSKQKTLTISLKIVLFYVSNEMYKH